VVYNPVSEKSTAANCEMSQISMRVGYTSTGTVASGEGVT